MKFRSEAKPLEALVSGGPPPSTSGAGCWGFAAWEREGGGPWTDFCFGWMCFQAQGTPQRHRPDNQGPLPVRGTARSPASRHISLQAGPAQDALPELSSEGDTSLQTSVDPLETSKVPTHATPVTQLGLRPTEPHLLMDYGSSGISVLGNCVSMDSLDYFFFFFWASRYTS